MDSFLPWSQDREAFRRCVTHRLLEPFPPVIYRDTTTKKMVIDIGMVAYFKTDEDFFDFCAQNEATLPQWVKKSRDLQSFDKTLRYVIDFLRRVDVYGSSTQLLDEYEKQTQPNNLP